jgi:hypothetical protein
MSDDVADASPVSWVRFVGAFLRELSVLVLVFGILDGLLEKQIPLPWSYWLAIVVAVSLFSLTLGILIEVRRR